MRNKPKIQIKPLDESSDYSIDNMGNLYSHKVLVKGRKGKGGAWTIDHKSFRSMQPLRAGKYREYVLYGYSINGKTKYEYAHRLVFRHFKGYVPEGLEVHHLDHNPRNNFVDNLSLVTPRMNRRLSWAHRRRKQQEA